MLKKITYLLVFMSVFSSAQERIQNFNVFTAGNGVSVKFTISKGAQCPGYRIWHGNDSITLKLIHSYPGICGDLNVSQDIYYFHETPNINQINYYKAELFPVEFSEIKSIYVSQPAKAGLNIFPNPIVNYTDRLNLQIEGINNSQLIGFVYNQFGQLVKELKLLSTFDVVTLNLNDLKNGLYTIKIIEGANTYFSKLIIHR